MANNDKNERISSKEGIGTLPQDPTLQRFTFIEGMSLLILIFLAMPLKYIWEIPEAVKIIGWIHGALFIVLSILIVRYCLKIQNRNLALKTFIILMLSAFLPFGWLLADKAIFSPKA